MKTEMIEQIYNVEGEATIYFKNRKLITDKLDLFAYKIINEVIKADILASGKMGQYHGILKGWYYSLIRTEEEREGILRNEELEPSLEKCYQTIKEVLSELDENEKNEVMYRLPWHLRGLLLSSLKEYSLNEYYVENVANMNELEELNFEDTCYFAIASYDTWAIDTFYDDIRLNQIEGFEKQIKGNLPKVAFMIENLVDIVKKGPDVVGEEDKHGLSIIAYLLKLRGEKKVELDLVDFYIITLSSMCFWHFEVSRTESTWVIKEGKFKHLKKIRDKLKKYI